MLSVEQQHPSEPGCRAPGHSTMRIRAVSRLVLTAFRKKLLWSMAGYQTWSCAGCCVWSLSIALWLVFLEGCTSTRSIKCTSLPIPLCLTSTLPCCSCMVCTVRFSSRQSKRCESSTFWLPPLPSCVIPTAIPSSHFPRNQKEELPQHKAVGMQGAHWHQHWQLKLWSDGS